MDIDIGKAGDRPDLKAARTTSRNRADFQQMATPPSPHSGKKYLYRSSEKFIMILSFRDRISSSFSEPA
jgi:hypothetical protein